MEMLPHVLYLGLQFQRCMSCTEYQEPTEKCFKHRMQSPALIDRVKRGSDLLQVYHSAIIHENDQYMKEDPNVLHSGGGFGSVKSLGRRNSEQIFQASDCVSIAFRLRARYGKAHLAKFQKTGNSRLTTVDTGESILPLGGDLRTQCICSHEWKAKARSRVLRAGDTGNL
jgi:hypothetical protein